jgi:shikimate kinase
VIAMTDQDPVTQKGLTQKDLARCDSVEKTIVLVGLMGAGKTTVGRRLAARLGIDFVDADAEIELAAGMPVEDIFEQHGEEGFRDGERRVIARLLSGDAKVLATGGGAFMDVDTRAEIAANGTSVWLRADLPLLMKRVLKRNNRPLLKKGDPERIMKDLMDTRYPVYAQSEITVDSEDQPHEVVVDRIVEALTAHKRSTG